MYNSHSGADMALVALAAEAGRRQGQADDTVQPELLTVTQVKELLRDLAAVKAPPSGLTALFTNAALVIRPVRPTAQEKANLIHFLKDMSTGRRPIDTYKEVRADFIDVVRQAADPLVRCAMLEIVTWPDLELIKAGIEDSDTGVRLAAISRMKACGYTDAGIGALKLLAPLVRTWGIGDQATEMALVLTSRPALAVKWANAMPALRASFKNEALNLPFWRYRARSNYDRVLDALDNSMGERNGGGFKASTPA